MNNNDYGSIHDLFIIIISTLTKNIYNYNLTVTLKYI